MDTGLRRYDGKEKTGVTKKMEPEEPFTSRGFRSSFGNPQDEKERYRELSACLSRVIRRDEFADGALFESLCG